MKLYIKKKEEEYKDYIKEHINNVKKAWNKMKESDNILEVISDFLDDNNNLDLFIVQVNANINNHDNSKYSKEEFDAYRKHFFPISDEEKELSKEEFETAWRHHYTHNLHHYDWWYENNKLDNMPIMYVVEMICDWEAMSYKFGTNTKEWYYKNIDTEIHLGEKQRRLTERILELL